MSKKEENNPKQTEEIIKIKVNETENKNNKINNTKSSFFEKIKEIDKSLARQTKKKVKIQMINTRIRNERWDITTNHREIKWIIKKYYE